MRVAPLPSIVSVLTFFFCNASLASSSSSSSSSSLSYSEKDPNSYPWGENPNNGYKMYWKDSPNVLNSLEDFESLYVRVHGCVWSEYGLGQNYDDDGENHDGDEQWYQTRIQPFRANAAFSLYGVLRTKGGNSNIGRRNCRKGTYINTFFTYEGADTILTAFSSNIAQTAFPDQSYGSAYCYEYNNGNNNNNGEDEHRRRHLQNRELGESQDGGDGDDDSESMTLGCSADSKFEIATFQGSSCNGYYYLNATDSLDTYNKAMSKYSCAQVWNYRKDTKNTYIEKQDDDANANNAAYYGYGSIAESLLSSSFSCDTTLYPNGLCPDPYGLKLKYLSNINASARRGKSIRLKNWQPTVHFFSWMFLWGGIALSLFSYYATRRESVAKANALYKKESPTGRGELFLGGWFRCIWTDIGKVLVSAGGGVTGAVQRSRQRRKSANKKSSSKNRSRGIDPDETVDDGGGKRRSSSRHKKKSRRSKKSKRRGASSEDQDYDTDRYYSDRSPVTSADEGDFDGGGGESTTSGSFWGGGTPRRNKSPKKSPKSSPSRSSRHNKHHHHADKYAVVDDNNGVSRKGEIV